MRIILVGANGAMGQTLQHLVTQTENDEIVAGIHATGTSEDFPCFTNFDDLCLANIEADVIIDFSHVSLTEALMEYAVTQQLPIMLATTGQNEAQEERIKHASHSIPILNAHNTSIGVSVMEHIVGEMTRLLYLLGYDIEIIEKHHRFKKDAPSGTAVMLKNASLNEIDDAMKVIHGRSGLGEERSHNEIGIHAIRGGNIVGEHTVIFANNEETLELTHRAGSKDIFARGALMGATFLLKASPGLYSMADALKNK